MQDSQISKEEIKKREYPQEMLLMGSCPECGQEINRQFVENTIDEIVDLAVSKERARIVEEIRNGTVLITHHAFPGRGIVGVVESETIINLINTK